MYYKSFFASLALAAACLCMTAPGVRAAAKNDKPLVIVFESDVHGQIDNYAALVGLRNAIAAADTAWVSLVSNGDFMHGTAVATADSGKYMPAMLNAVGHDVMSVGNHEFDWSMARLLELFGQVKAGITCCNLLDMSTGKSLFKPYIIKEYGPYKVAYVGVLTPATIKAGKSPFYAAGGAQLYDIPTGTLAGLVQAAVDDARRAGATHVVLLSHLGTGNVPYSTPQLISALRGVDAVIDGHSHTVNPGASAADMDGKPIMYAQTGNKLQRAGILTIYPSGKVSTQLLPLAGSGYTDEAVRQAAEAAYAASGTTRETSSSQGRPQGGRPQGSRPQGQSQDRPERPQPAGPEAAR